MLAYLLAGYTPAPGAVVTGLTISFAAGAMLLWRDAPKAVTLAVFAALSGTFLQHAVAGQDVRRSFFDVHKIFETADEQFRLLVHGTTIHGAMRVRDKEGAAVQGPPAPTAYYTFDGPIGQAIASVRAARPDHPDTHAPSVVVGLARDPAHLGAQALASSLWCELDAGPGKRVWADDCSTILTPILPQLRSRWSSGLPRS